MILFYLIMGLGATTIGILFESTRGLELPLAVSSVALLALTVTLSSIMLPKYTGAEWVPTPTGLVPKILSMAELKTGECLYDLGSGDGRLVISAVKYFGAKAVGIEIDPFRVFYSRLKISRLGLQGRARIVRGNFFNIQLGEADVIVVYLLQETVDKLREKLKRELSRPNCRVVSVAFPFKGWKPLIVDDENMIYLYKPEPAANAKTAEPT